MLLLALCLSLSFLPRTIDRKFVNEDWRKNPNYLEPVFLKKKKSLLVIYVEKVKTTLIGK